MKIEASKKGCEKSDENRGIKKGMWKKWWK